MKRRQKQYPMDGPNMEIQRLMEQPRRNAGRLRKYFKDRPNMRPETVAVAYLR